MKKCILCKKILSGYEHKRCEICYHKNRTGKHLNRISYKGKNNPRYIDGRTSKKSKCIICKKMINYFQNESKMCKKCMNNQKTIKYQGKNNPNFKGGKPKCINCGKILSTRKTKNYIPKRCAECFARIDVIVKHHIDLDRKNNKKTNILELTKSLHTSLHHKAYNYLVKIGQINKYIKWFIKKFEV